MPKRFIEKNMLTSLYSSQFLPIYQPSTLPVKLEG